MKVGFDLHGLFDSAELSPIFVELTRLLVDAEHEVHIITGSEQTPELCQELREKGVHWTHFFSVTDYHKAIGTPIVRDQRGRPWMDSGLWNRTKAEYCKHAGILIHFDDSDVYHRYFNTPYCHVIAKSLD